MRERTEMGQRDGTEIGQRDRIEIKDRERFSKPISLRFLLLVTST